MPPTTLLPILVISLLHPLHSNMPSSIFVGSGSVLPVTSVGDSVLPGPLYLNNILLTPDIIQNLLFVHQFTIDNSCSMEFDPFGLSVKDLATRNVIIQSNSSGPIYTLRLPTRVPVTHAFTAVASASTWHRRLHPGRDVISSLSSTAAIRCSKLNLDTLCHACQLGHHTKLPFYSSSSRANKPFYIIHGDLWTSPVLSISGYKNYLVVLDDFSIICGLFLFD
jgi:hypothetical protein